MREEIAAAFARVMAALARSEARQYDRHQTADPGCYCEFCKDHEARLRRPADSYGVPA